MGDQRYTSADVDSRGFHAGATTYAMMYAMMYAAICAVVRSVTYMVVCSIAWLVVSNTCVKTLQVKAVHAHPSPDDDNNPTDPYVLDEPIGPDMLDEPIGPDIEAERGSESGSDKGSEGESEGREVVDPSSNRRAVRLKTVTIIGSEERVSRVSGSAHKVGEEELEEQNYDDVHRVLKQVPGVYVRDEDGVGLRPNIGLRGANSDRSAKITLMEDGVLMAPAPYSAPAAYYFPITTRLTTVEVFKGPSSIQYGPNTIGGAINMVTRGTPLSGHRGGFDTSWGSYNTAKAHAHYGWGTSRFGFVLEGVRFQSDGFKALDGGGDTGFIKHEAMLKLRLNTDPDADVFHRLKLKLGWSDETSNETYLGLSAADFEAAPYRRYASTALAKMSWNRLQGKVDYEVYLGDHLEVSVVAYQHAMSRGWEKLNRFNNRQVTFEGVLADPTSQANQTFYDILRGATDSLDDADRLVLGLNDRSYLSRGVQSSASWRTQGEGWSNRLTVGARLHTDQIERNHSERLASMLNGSIVADSDSRVALENRGETTALSGFIFDELRLGERWRVTPGLRVERYETTLTDLGDAGDVIAGTDWVLLPGIGAWYTLSDHWGLLGGVHRGFSPLSLSQTGQSDPEVSVNYELGTRWRYSMFEGELIGFYNDYQNLVGTCTQSAGCPVEQLDEQFNAGRAQIAGLEWVTRAQEQLGTWGALDAALTYTYTRGRFISDFESGFAQWGDVKAGDALPYVPEHQMSLRVTLSDVNKRYGAGVSYSWVGPMLDSAGVLGDEPDHDIPAQHMIDLNAYAYVYDQLKLYLTVDNALNQAYLVSRRPFGARPSKPFLIQGGISYQF